MHQGRREEGILGAVVHAVTGWEGRNEGNKKKRKREGRPKWEARATGHEEWHACSRKKEPAPGGEDRSAGYVYAIDRLARRWILERTYEMSSRCVARFSAYNEL